MIDAGVPAAPLIPGYRGDWVGELVPALLDRGPRDILPTDVAGCAPVLLLVLDGLGDDMISRHEAELPVLGGMQRRTLTTVVPSTTAAALTSITTGATPAAHGVVGFRFRVGGEVLNTLRWRLDGGGRAPAPEDVQPIAPFAGEPVPVISKTEFAGTGFTRAHLRGGDLRGWVTPATIVTQCRRALETAHPLVYAYADGVDKVAHAYGLRDAFLLDELRATDRLVGDLLALLPRGAALMVTADHGHVHVGPQNQRSLAPFDGLIDRYSGEGRFRSLHARSGATDELRAALEDAFGDDAWVATRERIADEGWLGPSLSATMAGRLGDVVLAARADVAFTDPTYPRETALLGMHGSLTPAEVRVPLLWATP